MRFGICARATGAGLLMMMAAASVQAEGRSIIVLDASGSMWGQIDGRAKLEIAREALGTVLKGLPPETELGLMAYGHREKGSCDDIELIVPPGPGTAARITDAANTMSFLGKTPLSEAVRRAAAELRSTEEKATVILITDGIETCAADPCALGAELEASGVDFTAHVVGFGLTADEGKQVACLAENTGGTYIEARDASALVAALQTTVAVVEPAPAAAPEPPPQPQTVAVNFAPTAWLAPGVPKPDDQTDAVWRLYIRNADGTAGDQLVTEYNAFEGFIEPGSYILRATIGEVTVDQPLDLTDTSLAAPEVVFNAARVILHPKPAADEDVDNSAGLNIKNSAGVNSTAYGSSQFYLHAGEATLTGTLGLAKLTETLTLAAGETLERDVVIAAGVVGINGFYVEGMLIEGNNHRVDILSAKAKLDGSREVLSTSYGENQIISLSPGDYITRVSYGSASVDVPFSVTMGERVDVAAILNAGVLFISAPGAYSIAVYDAKKDLNGNRKQLNFEYREEMSLTAAAGDYVVEINRADVVSESPTAVTAGERTELVLP
ncbi:VWA domain-containing protein [Pseudotabrizicola sp.]|uniref:vWA domain-containing protein n=1 Tax=Pseudotabrizicola sp. TaxID=2939647 RepID=UPI002724B7EF|nr:VWA domain-containing protein [Pseudotabrizicola sp.]MDO8882328.1 VWA domain-containing protein [Pseudotabrizicola sp.]